MAQGAKPGEGGQLPGHKVSDYIGKLRYSVPGVGLISPPPHHDIYSIEDLAQLIHDLKNANSGGERLGEAGVGVGCRHGCRGRREGEGRSRRDRGPRRRHGRVAAVVAQARRHAVGTRSRRNAADAGARIRLRGRIRVQADGQMKTGRDVVIGALLGADEFGFATAPLVVEGCIMMRKCHLNTCPVGVATQDPVLRASSRASRNTS